MPQALQLEETTIIQLHDAPKLLVEWSPRWNDFVTSIRPAFARSRPRLAGEAPYGAFSYGSMVAALAMEILFVFIFAILPRKILELRPYAPVRPQPYEVIYYSGDELPRTEDLGGAHTGSTGRAGGHHAHHRTQTIHVARGGSMSPTVVDAPNVKLPATTSAANFLALKAAPGKAALAPPPSDGLHSSVTAPSLDNVAAPAQVNITREQLIGALGVDAIVPPAPSVLADPPRFSPTLTAAVVPPTPDVRSAHTLTAPSLDPNIVAPASNVSRDRASAAPSLSANVIGPASGRVARDQSRSTPALNAGVIPPAPAAVGHEVAPSRVRMNDTSVVPPPTSAPERDSSRTAKLTMPAPSVIAPPPSADSAHDVRRLESGGTGATSPTVVPPPAQADNTSFVSRIVGRIFGTQDVVPPPPSVGAAGSSGSGRNAPAGSGGELAARVVPPPPSVGGPSGAGSIGSRGASSSSSIGIANVIPPPPSVSTPRAAQGSPSGISNGTLIASNVVPPPPSAASGSELSGSGRKGVGLGGPRDVGSALAPPKGTNGSSDKSGVVLSSQPGSTVGLPGNGAKGALALSPAGGDKPGIGGSGNGEGIGNGNDPGSGLISAGPGAGRSGTDHGSDPSARAGISPTPGPGGAGSGAAGLPAIPGVDVRGGSTSTIVTLPSFGSDGGSSDPNLPARSSVKGQPGPAITIVATSRSGGAFNFYGKLPGDNYTVYVDTAIGTVVMQFAEADPAHAPPGALVGPQGLRTNLPTPLPHARVVIQCKVDTSGNLRNLQVLEPGPAPMMAKLMAALPGWKFRPATRGEQPVEVNAILGFNIDTNDRY